MKKQIEDIKKFVRAANFLSVGQIYLQNNFLLKDKITFDDIKTRLLGHWGTCPGINFTYGCLNNLINKTKANMMFVLGPGHGFPALQSCLFLEGTLSKYYKEAPKNEEGMAYIMKNFSWPYSFPSHSNPTTPGVILEGGELGYSLATSYGAVLDNPDLIVACLVGDGEAETASAATAWHLSKFVDPVKNGAVLPILHLNGYKISGPSIFGRMKNEDLKSLFHGYGYEPIIVEGSDDKVYMQMVKALDKAYASIKKIQNEARKNPERKLNDYFRFPMIVLKTPKGWTGIKNLYNFAMEGRGQKFNGKVEGNNLSHQVVGKNAKTDEKELVELEKWFKSYKFDELFDPKSGFCEDIEKFIPKEGLRMGDNPITFGIKKDDTARYLKVPSVDKQDTVIKLPGEVSVGALQKIGEYYAEVFKLNKEKRNLRIFSPDEIYSNRMHYVFSETTRAFAGKLESWDRDMARDGMVIEMLSENSMQGLAQGYTLTGRYAIFPSYESFMMIVASMAEQYGKFLKSARKVEWRGDIPSLTYISTSSGWRQEHNGFSHQNPGFIDTLLQIQHDFVNIYFPADANEAVLIAEKCLKSHNQINLIVSEKTPEPVWLTREQAEKEIEDGLSIWEFASDENPDIVIAGCGQYLTKEALAAVQLLKEEAPEAKVRFINIVEISPNTVGNSDKITQETFEKYFTKDKPVIFNFHGYPDTLEQTLFEYQNALGRLSIHGYIESGSTTTPLDLHIRNKTDRYNLFIEAIEKLAKNKVIKKNKASELVIKYLNKIKEHKEYITTVGDDPEEILNWKWLEK
jgi:xylulose-5-phosphate/fructose-6-phosphate phosphoketolase